MTDVIPEELDVISTILGVESGSPIARVRDQFPQNQLDFQAYYDALFAPTEASLLNLPLPTRFLLAVRTATHTRSEAVANWYGEQARQLGITEDRIASAQNLTSIDTDNPVLEAAYRHADLLATHPVDASKSDLEKLKRAGLSPAGIVTLSQIVAFVSYQVRFVSLLRVVGEIS